MNYLINAKSVKFRNFFCYASRYCEIKIILEKIASVEPINLIYGLLSAITMFVNRFRLQFEKSRFSIDYFKSIRTPAIAKIKQFFSAAVLTGFGGNSKIFYSANKKIKKTTFDRSNFLLPYGFVLICPSCCAPGNKPFGLGWLISCASVLDKLLLSVIFMFLATQVFAVINPLFSQANIDSP
ncbi:hypothetical protein [Cellvibrio sp. QJXJ]|uniref:hypothetical protein n=1 Tax=Cellvibrio sp. QJXJ TaxID=2964606 RepID=UPI0021C3496D|nr:hypothetical protein [Cellvibrio sp. QJXJ]UUA73380.1 hypothetical protein NNX04_02755 [Cellvibrio sp. QJXJ]